MLLRTLPSVLLLLALWACSEWPLAPTTAGQPGDEPRSPALTERPAEASSDLAIVALEDALGRVLPVLADEPRAQAVGQRLHTLLAMVVTGDAAAVRGALGLAHDALEAYATGGSDASVQAPELEVIRLVLFQVRAALPHLARTHPTQ